MDHIMYSREGWNAFKDNDRAGPIHMLNLVALREAAVYEDGRAATGAQAYAEYGRLSRPVFERLGGRIVWRGGFEQMLIGPEGKAWDYCFVAAYPDVGAFIAMQKDPDYLAAVVHRQAGVRDSRLIRCLPETAGGSFAG